MSRQQPSNPFKLNLNSPLVGRAAEKVLGLAHLANLYDQREPGLPPAEFLRYVLNRLKVELAIDDERQALEQLPASGPLLVVANHPLGGLEGVALASELLRHRPDTKVLTNALLTRIPELRDIFIGVDILSSQASRTNTSSIREAHAHLANGGTLLLFPAGKVATYDFSRRKVRDHPWNRFAGSLLRKTGASVLPVYVNAYNSRLFYALSLLHPMLRTAMLPRELANKHRQRLQMITGELIQAREFRHMGSDESVTTSLRLATELLKPNGAALKKSSRLQFSPLASSLVDKPASASDALRLQIQRQLLQLEKSRLVSTDTYDVYVAPFEQLGLLKDEIGVAREATFRAAGEGTGNSSDIDRFDPHYLHLFCWDKQQSRVVGGYRLGRVKEIVAKQGLDGLYARTLYAFDEAYIEKLGNPLELGRSFVHPDYQRKPAALDLLWRGVGRYIAKHPEFNFLFGAVSISNEHSDMARALISECMLESFQAEQHYLQDVEPLAPLEVSGKAWDREILSVLSHVPLVNKLIGCADPGKALPTLLRHYLSLNGKFVCFSVNKVFNDSLDGLILVNMRQVPQKYLNRYLGKQGAAEFARYWAQRDREAVPLDQNSPAQISR
ncbi:MAG: lysophospholipid acyltransferase family protein [Gammaproteobacteria bacterium]|nr:lysophospholipid acyltransferase family protein [Gammaproteobacteria bacterium]